METQTVKTETAPVFEYKIGFKKEGNKYRLAYYNSPYKNSEQELDDICAMFDGKTIDGQEVPMYKVVKWESLEDGEWEACVRTYFVKNRGEETYDQTFVMKEIKKIGG